MHDAKRRKSMKTFLFFILIILVLFIGFYFWASQSNLQAGWSMGAVETSSQEENINKTKIKIMTWNMSYAHGLGSEGPGYIKHAKEHYEKNLKMISDYIRENDIDILLLQEIDFGASRTYFIDEAKVISDNTGLSHIAYAPSWDNRYIPFPYFPIKAQFGKMNSGGAILSRFPIVDNQVYLFDKPKANPFWYNAFYLYRFFQAVKIQILGQSFYLGNLHTEAFDKFARMEQARTIVNLKKELASAPWFVIGGDFNSTPSYASKRSSFEGYPEDDYESDETLKIFNENFVDLKEIVSASEYQRNESNWFTFPTNKPDRRLDYFYLNEKAQILEKEVGSSLVSDHFPLIMEVDINSLLR